MEKELHKRIIVFSLVSISIFIVLTGVLVLLGYSFLEVLAFTMLILALAVISIVSSYVIVHPEIKWIKKASKFSIVSYPLFLFAIAAALMNLNNTLLIAILIVIICVLTLLSLMHIYIFSDAVALKSTIWFIVLLISSIFLKRYHLPMSGFVLTVVSLLFASGNFMYGIRCLYLSEKIKYLKYVTFFGSLVISIFFFGLLYKLQHWPGGGILIITSHISLVLGTIIVLLTLPSSGIIDWQPFHKKMLKRIILPWIFIFTLFIIRYLLPELDTIIWKSDKKEVSSVGFEMFDYTIDIKNGLKPE